MNHFRILSISLLILVFSSHCIFSQTFEDFKKQVSDKHNTFDKETSEKFETFKRETQQRFDNFVAEIDKEFSDYLVENFGVYEISHDNLKKEALKPETIPIAEEIELSSDMLDYVVNEVVVTYQGPVFPGIKKTESSDFEINRIDVHFLGWPLYFDLDKAFFNMDPISPSAENISSF